MADWDLIERFVPPAGCHWAATGEDSHSPVVYCVELDQPALANGAAVPLSREEQMVAASLRTPRLASRYRAAHAALRLILGARCCRSASSLTFEVVANGKPVLRRASGDPPLAFNLSHSGPVALIAVSRGQEIGVDVEAVLPFAGLSALVDEVFTVDEAAVLRAEPEAQRLHAFYTRWTAKEAAMKALGLGLALEPSAFSATDAGFSAFDAAHSQAAALSRLAVASVSPLDGYVSALVGAAPLAKPVYRRWPR